eukprot:XP_011668944.1 PREDICTED: uncharacterized protein LOC100890124 [Strongylocentrotus purpuratus]
MEIKLLPIFIFISQVLVDNTSGAQCIGLSADVVCECDGYGRCMKGTLEIDPWLQFALKTQREIQIDLAIDRMQIFDAHNAFNNRAYGLAYGANDTCQWPPPYDNVCLGWANHEFSIIDMLNMGVRAVEIDNWYCDGEMRVAHLGTRRAIGCGEFNVLFSDVIADIGQWMHEPGNENDFIRIYINEKYDQGYDAEVNSPLERYLGHDEILSPADLRDTYRGVYPTLRRMREDGKRVFVVSGDDTLHQGKYIHVGQCDGSGENAFTNYPQCGGKTETYCRRFRGDATHYVFGAIYDGPTASGAITDMSEMVKCRINLIATDMVTPQLMKTGVYTWAYGEPSLQLDEDSCVVLNHEDFRWYTSPDCDQSLSYACQSSTDPNDWLVSESTGPYDVTRDLCPIGYKFSLPHNGFRQQKLKEAMKGSSVWLNFTPWLTGNFPVTEAPLTSPSGNSAYNFKPTWTSSLVVFLTAAVSLMF